MRASKSRRLTLTHGDKILIGALLLIGLASVALLGRLLGEGDMAVVEVDGHLACRLDLSVDCRRTVTGPLGESIVEVRGGRVRMVESACPHKICVRSGWAGGAGAMIVCVPNRVVVRVEGSGEDEMDGVTW